MLRRTCLAVIGVGLLISPAIAQGDYPSRTVRIIVPATPGGGSDTFARLIAQHLAKELNQQFVVENRPGGGTLPAMEFVASQPADGHTLYLSPSTTTSMHLVRKSMPWDVRKAFSAVTQIAVVPQSLVINPKVPATTVKEFIALAKREPGKLSYGSAGTGHRSAHGDGAVQTHDRHPDPAHSLSRRVAARSPTSSPAISPA